ncbi:MAG TPA: response regulator [Chthoniobacterales bacterium]|nr:response regulator [Chthoniobacterales bacterium]
MTANDAPPKEGRVMVLEPEEQVASAILSAVHEAAPAAQVDMAHSLQEAQQLVVGTKPDLFVLDIDATQDLGQDFLYDLRTSHPNARAIILTATHLPAQREQTAGLGAIHFLEKPFPHRDFVDLAEALLRAPDRAAEKFRGTLSDLHIADVIQLKCMSGATSVVEFTGPRGEKARVFFEKGQVRHATAPGTQGIAAFNEIVSWKGGTISEVSGAAPAPRTIDQDWQFLLMEAARKSDEHAAAGESKKKPRAESVKRKVLVIDDSLMLLSFVEEVLAEANYEVRTASAARTGLDACKAERPDLVLLDYILPDMKGDEVSRRLLDDPTTADVPVVYMSGYGADLKREGANPRNVIGFLNKPFTSDLLVETVEEHTSQSRGEVEPAEAAGPDTELLSAAKTDLPTNTDSAAPAVEELAEPETTDLFQEQAEEPPRTPEATPAEVTSSQASPPTPIETDMAPLPSEDLWAEIPPPDSTAPTVIEPMPRPEPTPTAAAEVAVADESVTGGPFFCGDTRFFSLNRALQTIRKQKLTGWLRAYWPKAPVELLTRNGEIVLVTTRDAQLYCPDEPITLVNVDPERIVAARSDQGLSGCPLFLTLAEQELILREPAVQLVQHYGQKLFAQLWTAPHVRFLFERSSDYPEYATDLPSEADLDHWALASLRFLQFQDLGDHGNIEVACIPAYTKDGFERAQNLKLTVAEAQFASQFNGSRSVQQIARNLRLDLKFARLTLFRFLALEIVECWPATAAVKPEKTGIFQRLTRSIGMGE